LLFNKAIAAVEVTLQTIFQTHFCDFSLRNKLSAQMLNAAVHDHEVQNRGLGRAYQ
jgi:hypothetical protein